MKRRGAVASVVSACLIGCGGGTITPSPDERAVLLAATGSFAGELKAGTYFLSPEIPGSRSADQWPEWDSTTVRALRSSVNASHLIPPPGMMTTLLSPGILRIGRPKETEPDHFLVMALTEMCSGGREHAIKVARASDGRWEAVREIKESWRARPVIISGNGRRTVTEC